MIGRVLLVDDEEALLDVLAEILRGEGFEVTACASGAAALAALRASEHDAVLSDVSMPGMDGLSLLKAVRERDAELPVVLMTGAPSLETAVEAVDRGALKYLTKPISSSVLVETAHRALRLSRLARFKRAALESAGLEPLAGDRAGLEVSFERAVASLWMAVQPIVEASTGEPRAHEALLRTGEAAYPNPGVLLSVAERLGRLHDLGRVIRGTVASMLEAGQFARDAFVNLHPADLLDDSLLDPRAPLSRFASRVVLEVTERASLDRVAELPGRVGGLRQLGYRIAIDDLGAGYAGLSSFAALNPEIVKLDMSLTRGLDRDPVKQKLVASMGRLCGELGILVVAEGIESAAERDAAAVNGCTLVQGFLIGMPGRVDGPGPRGQ
jgi:EAL domain-containing protein (putative c-di-GMP-specific phosphodiesterase class I)